MAKRDSQKKTNLKTNSPDPRRHLIVTARKLFAQKGLTGTSIRDIARQAKTNSCMISYYFGGKNELYIPCLEEICNNKLEYAKEILIPVHSKEEFRERLFLLLQNLFTLYTDDRDAGLIVVREYDRLNSPADKVFKETFLKIFELLVTFFAEAQKNKFVDPKKDPFILASLFFGCLSNQMRLDHIQEKSYGRSLKNLEERENISHHIVDLFLEKLPS
jgi:AcrR family transcriptional regulator